ncbi:helix-turn-helix transcriptional regulator [Halovulum sp. GXIMD14793]
MLLEKNVTNALPTVDIDTAVASALTERIGQQEFVSALMAFGRETAAADLISVFCMGDRDTPLLIGTASILGNNRAELAAKNYVRHSSVDRNAELLTRPETPGDFLTVQTSESIQSFPYRRDCYERPRIGARMSLIRRRRDYGLSVSLYRAVESPPFRDSEYDRIAALLGVMLNATERHVAFTLKDKVWREDDIQIRLALNYPEMTDREREVAAMTVKGRTASEIAAILGIAETTVITHRKRAYRRMNVSNLRELMATYNA